MAPRFQLRSLPVLRGSEESQFQVYLGNLCQDLINLVLMNFGFVFLSGGHSIAISGIPIYLNNQQRVKPTSKFPQAELSPSEQQIAPAEILDLDKLHRAQGEKETGILNECDDQKNCIISSAIVRVSQSITLC